MFVLEETFTSFTQSTVHFSFHELLRGNKLPSRSIPLYEVSFFKKGLPIFVCLAVGVTILSDVQFLPTLQIIFVNIIFFDIIHLVSTIV